MAIEPFNTRMRIRKSSLGSGRVMVDPRRGLHVYDLPRGLIKLWKHVASGCCFKVFLCAGGCLKVFLGSCFCTHKILNWWYFFAFFLWQPLFNKRSATMWFAPLPPTSAMSRVVTHLPWRWCSASGRWCPGTSCSAIAKGMSQQGMADAFKWEKTYSILFNHVACLVESQQKPLV